jgi:hypothetical protein
MNYGINDNISSLLNGNKKNGYNLQTNYDINELLDLQIKNELNNLYQKKNLNSTYYNNGNLLNPMNGNDLTNLYKLYQLNNNEIFSGELNPFQSQNISSNINQINNFYDSHLSFINNTNPILNNAKLNHNNIPNENYQYNKIYKIENFTNNNINNNIMNGINDINSSNNNNSINSINNMNYLNHNLKPNHNHNNKNSNQMNIKFINQLNNNNNLINHNYNHNNNHNTNHNYTNHNNNKSYINAKEGFNENDLSDAQIDSLFTQLYALPKEVCLLLYIINKKGVPYFINLIKTIKGSKYLQNILLTNPPKESEIDYITKIICNNYTEIMCDYYGNYFLQKFFPYCNFQNRIDILNSIKDDYITIANDICGNHSLQCLISLQNSNEEKEIVKICIQSNLKELCFGVNSSHVISKIIKCIKESERQYINAFIINNLMHLCVDSNGICIVKEFIYNIQSNFYIKLIISTFEKETIKLTLNQFGNFVIQEAIKFFGYNFCKNIVNNLIKNIVKFSVSKFSSNVIDFLLEYLSKKEFYKFCVAIKKIFLKENNFKEMIKNKFSIYVIENSLELLGKINENYYINAMKNNLGNDFHKKKSAKSLTNNNKEEENSNSDDDEDNNMSQDEDFSYQNFCKLKKKIFQFIENNSAAKEKKKILALIKANKYKNL